jgi:hypothetical protein
MSTIIPDSELLKRAVKWISVQLKQDPETNKLRLLQDAVFRFNLSPKDEEFLYRFYSKK